MNSCAEREIEKIKKQYQFQVQLVADDDEDFSWRFDGKSKNHIITHPTDTSEHFFILNLLHEFIHGLHFEQLPKEFSYEIVNLLDDSDPFGHFKFHKYFNSSRDWFVNGHIYTSCSKEMSEMNESDCNDILQKIKDLGTQALSENRLLIAGLTFAEAKKWRQIEFKDLIEVKPVVEAYLSVSPHTPSVESKRVLVQNLFSSIGRYKATSFQRDNKSNWDIQTLSSS